MASRMSYHGCSGLGPYVNESVKWHQEKALLHALNLRFPRGGVAYGIDKKV